MLFVTSSLALAAPSITSAAETREEIMAKCQKALQFWPDLYRQLLADYVKADLADAQKVACDRVVAGVLAGRITADDFSLKGFLQSTPPELKIILSGH